MLYSFDDYTVDVEDYELRLGGRLVRLAPRVFNLLAYLVQHPGRLVTNEELKEQLWPKREAVGESSLSNAVAQARKALADTGQVQRYIQTVHRRGYRFVAPVTARPPGVADLPAGPTPDAPQAVVTSLLDKGNAVSPPPLVPSAPLSASMPVPLSVPRSEVTTSDAASDAVLGTPEDAWRPLTVLACQLVGVPEHAMPHDREARLAVVRDYQAMCTEVMQQFDGHLVQSHDERLLVYFGYPQAHEDDARRAVHTGLEIIEGMGALNRHRQLDSGVRLAVQAGIHTGVELVGAVGGGDQRAPLVLGNTPTMAAGLQCLAAPDTVVISPATWRLVEGYFVGEVVGTHVLADLSEPVTVYRVLQESPAHTRLEVAITRGLTPFVGREHELGLLHECWAQATEGRGQVVVLRGEAGIGKSRLVQEFTSHLTGKPYTRFEFHCSPYYQHTAFYPVVTALQRLLQFKPEETAEERLGTLEALLGPSGEALRERVPLWAALLSLRLPARYPPLSLTPQSQRQKTLEALLGWLLHEAERQPLCVLVEDLHWADASTVEWLTLLIDQVPTACVLLLLVCRAEFPMPWAGRTHLSHVTLRHLSRPHVEIMVQRLTGRKVLPAEVLRHLVATTDGVPLFVEELTKMILESELVNEREGHYELAGPMPSLAIPATLHDSLMARLDRLGPAKQVAQLGAVLGRAFPYELIQAVAPINESTLQHALMGLVGAELLYQRGLPPQVQYTFKHALIQEVAYQSLLRSTRRHYHRQIAQVLEERFPETREAQPELLAHHYTEAGLAAQAVPYWQQAGQRAVRRSANAEALSQFMQGLRLLQTLADSPERTQQELDLQLDLGGVLRVIRGSAASEVEYVYDRALKLARYLPDTAQRIRVLSSLAAIYDARGGLRKAQALGEECLALAQRDQDPESLRQGHQALGRTLYWRGQIVSARAHLEHAFTLSNAQQDRSPPFFATRLHPREHSRMTNLCMTALILYLQGYPDQARQRCHMALDLAQELSHPYSLVAVLLWASWLHIFCGEGQAAHERLETAVAMAIEQGFPLWQAMGTILRGWALVAQEQGEEGITQMHRGLAALRTMEVKQAIPSYLILLAEAYAKEGRTAEGLRIVDEALAEVEKTGARWEEAALYRLKGELLLACAAGHQGEPEACFQQALDVARRQQAKSFELQAAVSLARLRQRQVRHNQARQLLAEVYGWFTEGFDTAALQEARVLLEELR